jgi:sec-independent protein translocase protein TatB
MLDIGFAELLVVSAIALFVVGPERLPSALRSMSLWVGRVRRGFEEIKADVSREMHNEEVMRALKESRDEVQDIADVSSALSIEPPTTINTTANTAIDTATDTTTDSETLPDKEA